MAVHTQEEGVVHPLEEGVAVAVPYQEVGEGEVGLQTPSREGEEEAGDQLHPLEEGEGVEGRPYPQEEGQVGCTFLVQVASIVACQG